jgi:hypothetical protein
MTAEGQNSGASIGGHCWVTAWETRFHGSRYAHNNIRTGGNVYSVWSMLMLYNEDQRERLKLRASCRRRQKGNLVPGGITGPPCSWGI